MKITQLAMLLFCLGILLLKARQYVSVSRMANDENDKTPINQMNARSRTDYKNPYRTKKSRKNNHTIEDLEKEFLFFLLNSLQQPAKQQQNNTMAFSHDRGIIYNVVLTSAKDLENVKNGRLEHVNLLGKLVQAIRLGKGPLENAKAAGKETKVALFADVPVISALQDCAAAQDNKPAPFSQGAHNCSKNASSWAQQVMGGVDQLVPYDEAAVPPALPRHRESSYFFFPYHHVPLVWWKRIWALKHSPFKRTLALDLDAILCDPFLGLFEPLEAKPGVDPVHVVDSIAKLPFGGSGGNKLENVLIPQDRLSKYENFPERNCGAVVVDNTSPEVQKLLELYEYIFIKEMNAPKSKCFRADQTAWREAMFLMTSVEPGIRELVAEPQHLCRVNGSCTTGCWISH